MLSLPWWRLLLLWIWNKAAIPFSLKKKGQPGLLTFILNGVPEIPTHHSAFFIRTGEGRDKQWVLLVLHYQIYISHVDMWYVNYFTFSIQVIQRTAKSSSYMWFKMMTLNSVILFSPPDMLTNTNREQSCLNVQGWVSRLQPRASTSDRLTASVVSYSWQSHSHCHILKRLSYLHVWLKYTRKLDNTYFDSSVASFSLYQWTQ